MIFFSFFIGKVFKFVQAQLGASFFFWDIRKFLEYFFDKYVSFCLFYCVHCLFIYFSQFGF